ncbi:MAG: branched-chain amino acid transaminase [candidate division WOR-3 bacterium]|jgi:branched-chain amino acid aminotransferase|nr:branched-chain amino acid transaminase [candidate division WOR-3 bacterium]MCR4424546.1 branched-chain amino acid transaminase [candidate division WOR-3 bacterium]MDH7519312.1 branched-chain amino acid transaminase [bacterium]
MGLEETKSKFIWMNGNFVPWEDARIHICSHIIHYGTGVFEGLRCYNTPKGPAIFRLQDHTERLFNSAKIYRMELPFTKEEINQATVELIKKNELNECYIRPIVYRGYQELGVNPFTCPVEVALITWKWGKYLGPEALEQGVDVMVSSWNRMAPNTFPAMAKCCANYMNSQLIKMEALTYGFVEGIALDVSGFVSEGSGENIFAVRKGVIYTPPLHATILPGITRDTVITLARELGYEVRETSMLREFLYLADELFFTGSAAEVTPIRSVDRIPIGTGKCGPVTKRLQEEFFALIEGKRADRYNWLTFVK